MPSPYFPIMPDLSNRLKYRERFLMKCRVWKIDTLPVLFSGAMSRR
jgi:hypothetical protein